MRSRARGPPPIQFGNYVFIGVYMKNKWKSIRLAAMLIALPCMATAAASAHQWISQNEAIVSPAGVTSADAVIGASRVHNVILNSTGAIEGRIATIDADSHEMQGLSKLKVFLIRNGAVSKEVVTDSTGTFTIDNVSEGAYSFVATGENGFAAYGVNVVANDGTQEVNVIEAAAVSPQFETVQNILSNNLPQTVADEIAESTNSNAKDFVGSNRVKLVDGGLRGHVVPLLGEVAQANGTYVHLIQNNQQVAEVQTDATGAFHIADLAPGVYDFVAAGPSGFAAVSFEAVQEDLDVAASVMDSEEIPVAIAAEPAAYQDMISTDLPMDMSSSLDVCLTCGQDAGFVGEQVSYAGTEVYPESYDTGYYDSAPIEYAGEMVSTGGSCGGSCGQAADFSGYSSCNTCSGAATGGRRGLFGGGLFGGAGGAGGLSRLLLLGGLGAAVAIPTSLSGGSGGAEATPATVDTTGGN